MSRATQVRGTMGTPKNNSRSSTTHGSSTILVNLDVYILRATIGRDISPDDDDLIVLFRRNSKEVTSEPTRWHDDHIAEWNQHVGIQTSLLRNKQLPISPDGSIDYLPKDYEVVLVALPSHSAVALFTLDFAQIVQTQRPNKPKPFRISPAKCRDLAATLEFEVVWEFASPPPPPPPLAHPPLTPTGSTARHSHNPMQSPSVATTTSSSLSMAGRRTNVSVVSMSSQSSELTSHSDCGDCRSLRRRLERKELQILQLENFLKESQKRIDSLLFENEELLVREQAETANAAQYRALNMRLLQELEMAFQFCAQQMLQAQTADPTVFMFLPQFEFMERVKKFHAELELIFGGSGASAPLDLHDSSVAPPPVVKRTIADAWNEFDFRVEMDAALERNQRLQQQLEFLARSLAYEAGGGDGGDAPSMLMMGERGRKATNASSASELSSGTGDEREMLSSSRAAPVRSVTEQLNALERENFVLKAKLETAQSELKNAQLTGLGGLGGLRGLGALGGGLGGDSECADTATSESSASRQSLITASLALLPAVPDESALRVEVEQLRDDKLELVQELETLRTQLQRLQRESMNGSPNPPAPLTVGVVPPASTNNNNGGGLGNSRTSMASVGSGTTPAGADFLNKIYLDVGKAKVALEEKVKRLTAELTTAQDENERLQEQLQKVLSEEPKIVELLSDDEEDERHQSASPVTATTSGSSLDGDAAEERMQLEAQLQQLQQLMEDKTSHLKVLEQELEFMKQHLTEKATKVADLEASKTAVEGELTTAKKALVTAEKKITTLEIKIETLEHDQRQQREVQETRAVAPKPKSDDEVSELTKQLKLARQEVMQLRYRSNNLESVHEKLEEAMKEKKTLQVKLTALEGQLYEQRSRTTSGMNFSSDGAKDVTIIEELQRSLDQKSAQLMIAQREAESLRRELNSGAQASAVAASAAAAASSKSHADVSELESKVAQFASEISRLGERNDEQALRINALSERVEKTTREKYELEGIMKEMLKEMDELAALDAGSQSMPSPARAQASTYSYSSREPSSHDSEDSVSVDEMETKPLASPPAVKVRSAGNKAVERYANALKSTFERRGSAPRAPAPSPTHAATPSSTVTKSKVAHLIKNFSADDAGNATATATEAVAEDGGKRRSTLTGAVKKITRIDFRQRQGSEPKS